MEGGRLFTLLSLLFRLFICVFLSLSPSALFAPRLFAARPGQKSPTAQHDGSSSEKDKEEGINYTTVDWREFMCNTWHLEPTLRSAPPPGFELVWGKRAFSCYAPRAWKNLQKDLRLESLISSNTCQGITKNAHCVGWMFWLFCLWYFYGCLLCCDWLLPRPGLACERGFESQ